MNATQRRMFAFGAALLMLAVPCTIVMSDDTDEQETDAVIPIIMVVAGYSTAQMAMSFIAGFTTGYVAGNLFPWDDPEDMEQEFARAEEAKLVASSISAGVSHYTNAVKNYANVWSLTSDHWKRQAEVTAAALWDKLDGYSTVQVLFESGVYVNSATMLSNATQQINEHFDNMADHVAKWNGISAYADDKMEIQFRFGSNNVITANGSLASSDKFDVRMAVVAEDVTDDANQFYFSGGSIYASEPAWIVDVYDSTNRHLLNEGWNEIGERGDVENQCIYAATSGVTYAGDIMPCRGSNAADMHAGLVIDIGAQDEIIVYDGYQFRTVSGKDASDIRVVVVPENNADEQSTALTGIIQNYEVLLDTVEQTVREADSAARTVWSIYDKNGEASAYLTTLMVPENYDGIDISPEWLEVITVMAMQQLADYSIEHSGDIKLSDYTMTMNSLQLYCRGTIEMPINSADVAAGLSEKDTYRDVIFTPIFQRDASLRVGENDMDGYVGYVAIWGKGAELSSLDTMNMSDATIVFMDSGSKMSVTQIMYNNLIVDSVDLEVDNIDIIDAEEMEDFDPVPVPEPNDTAELIRMVALIFGLLIAVYGVVSKNFLVVIVGAIIIMVGWIGSEFIEDALEDWFDWKFQWPGRS